VQLSSLSRYFIVGGAGFLGSHFTDRLLADHTTKRVTLFDNFTSGREWHYEHHLGDDRLQVVRADVKDLPALTGAMDGHDVVIHLASNPDIARAATEPDIDFREGTFLTQQVVEAMRCSSAKRILYASGSGVYGDLGQLEAEEDMGPMAPVSTYGASKLAGEALISSYSYMFDLTGCVFRFGNVVGPRQTHGVGFDFLRQLLHNPKKLRILGDGTQSKSYIHACDVTAAVLRVNRTCERPFSVQNVATGDYITVREIAELAVECAGLPKGSVEFEFTGGNRGWKGDVPIVRLNTDRIQAQGWKCTRKSREALRDAMISMLPDAGRLYS
jgi:UDP-glucose 4-epimerase